MQHKRYSIHFTLVTIIILVLQLVSATTIQLSYGLESPSFLQTKGNLIVDGKGTTIRLRGTNFMGYEFGTFQSHTYLDYQKIASLGFNIVRLPIAWSFIEPKRGRYDDSYLKYVDRDVAWAKSLNMYIVLDMHQYLWSNRFNQYGNGMPSWMVANYPADDSGRLSSITNFWSNSTLRNGFKRMWQYVASRYKNEPTIIGYDILNEPSAGRLNLDNFIATVLPKFYQETITAIRMVDSKHIIFYETPLEAQHRQVKLSASKIVFAPHFYFLALGTSYDGPLSTLEWALNSQTQGMTIPVWIGEFGIDTKTQNYQNWIKDTLGLFNKYNVGWAYWTYWKDDNITMGLAHSDGTLRMEITNLLSL